MELFVFQRPPTTTTDVFRYARIRERQVAAACCIQRFIRSYFRRRNIFKVKRFALLWWRIWRRLQAHNRTVERWIVKCWRAVAHLV